MARRTQELLNLRTRHQKVFASDEPDTKIAVIGAAPIHYETPEGGWDDLANLVKSVAGGWVAQTKDTRVGVENGYLTFTHAGKSLQMRPTAIGMVDATAPATRWRKLGDADYSNVTRDGDTIIAHDIFPNTDLALTIEEGVVSKAFTVRTRPSLPDPVSLGWNPDQTYVVIVWDVQKPAGAVVKDAVTDEVVASGYAGTNALRVETATGEPVLYFDAGTAVSASGVTKPVWYVCLGPQVPFGEAQTYRRFVAAPFPLVIDPTARVATPASPAAIGDIANYVGNYEVNTSTGRVGNTYYYDPGDPYAKPPVPGGEGGGPCRAFARFNLASLSGTCTSAKLRGEIYAYDNNFHTITAERLSTEWYPLGTNAGTKYAAAAAATLGTHQNGTLNYVISCAHKPGTNIWVRIIGGMGAGNPFFQRSTDNGATWTAVSQASFNVTEVGWVNERFYAYGGNSVAYSNDGSTWYGMALSSTSPTMPVYTGAGYVVGSYTGVTQGLSFSADGVTGWSNYGSPVHGFANNIQLRLMWSGSELWAYAVGGSIVAPVVRKTSTANGSSGWATVAAPGEGLAAARSMTSIGGTPVLAGRNASYAYYLWSWGGSSWTLRISGALGMLSTDGTYAYFGTSAKTIWRSQNGVDWDAPTLSFPFHGGSGNGVAPNCGDNGHLIVPFQSGQQTQLIYMESFDYGTTWVERSAGAVISFAPAEVQSRFGNWLWVRFVDDGEDTGAHQQFTIQPPSTLMGPYLEVEYSTRTPDGPGIAVNAVIQKTSTGSLAVNAAISRITAGTIAADAVIQNTLSGSFTVDAVIASASGSTVEGSFAADAVIQSTITGSVTADAVIQNTLSGSLAADAAIQRTFASSFAADAVVKRLDIAGSVAANAVVKKLDIPGTFSANAVVGRTFAGTFSADATIRKLDIPGAIAANAAVQRTFAGTVAADAAIGRTFAGSFAADATIAAATATTYTGTFSADATIQSTLSGSLAANATIKSTLTGSLAADATIRRLDITGSLAANAAIGRVQPGSMSADAVIKRLDIPGAISANAAILRVQPGSTTADATIKRLDISGSLAANAVVQATLSGTVAADAAIRRIFTGSLAADAAIGKTTAGSFSADAQISHVGSIVWTTPGYDDAISDTPTFAFRIPPATGNLHFRMDLDTVDTFDSPDFRRAHSLFDQTGWEYWNGGAWVAIPPGGVSQTYVGNEARYTIQTPLAADTWFRRVRGNV